MRILVTGGLGVNGSWLTRRLVAEGHDVVVFDDRDDYSLVPELQGQLETVVGDILDVGKLRRVLETHQCECVAHLAALMPDSCVQDPALGLRVNAQGTVCVLEAARLAGCRRVVFTSSMSVYGPRDGDYGYPTYKPIGEDFLREPMATDRAYGAGKVLGEDAGLCFHERYGLEFIALRFATIYAVGKDVRHGRIAIHGAIIENAMRGLPTHISRGVDELDDMLYVKDVAQAIARACTASTTSHFLNIGSGRLSSLSDLVDAVRELYPAVDVEIGPGLDYAGYPGVYGLMDIAQARRELGYEPEFDVRQGVRDYVETALSLGKVSAH